MFKNVSEAVIGSKMCKVINYWNWW